MGNAVQPRLFGTVVTLIICGTALVLMPQIHDSVVKANLLFALGIAQDHSASAASRIEMAAKPNSTWVAATSMGVGSLMILTGACTSIVSVFRRLPA